MHPLVSFEPTFGSLDSAARDEDAPAQRRDLVDKLLSPAWTLLPQANRPIVEFLADAVSRWPTWPSGMGLAWMDRRLPAACAGGVHDRIMVVSEREVQGQPQLVVDMMSPSTLSSPVPAHSARRQFVTLPVYDALDAIALALDAAQPLQIDVPRMVLPGHRPGLLLRNNLAHWLRHEVRDDQRLPSLAWSVGGVAPVVAGASADAAGAVEPLSLKKGPVSRTLVGELAAALRRGAWDPVLEEIVIQLVTRLPDNHPYHIDAVDLRRDERQVTYCARFRIGCRAVIQRTRQGAHWTYALLGRSSGLPTHRFEGPNGLLQALMPWRHKGGRYPAAEARAHFADVMEINPSVVMLCAALQEEFPNHPQPDVLLRLCLRAGLLTDAGRQLLDPSLPQRTPTAHDLLRWCRDGAMLPGERLQTFLHDGVHILKAHCLFGPAGLTKAGRDLLNPPNAAPAKPIKSSMTMQHIEAELPDLLYAYHGVRKISDYLGQAYSTFFTRHQGRFEDARTQAGLWQEEDRLLTPAPP